MEFRIAKALDSESNLGLLRAKRKRAAHAALTSNAACAALGAFNLPTKKIVKRQKLEGFNGESAHSGCFSRKSISRYYSNFMRTGTPQRLMFYCNGEWIDFPKNFLGMIKKDLQMKRATVEVELNGYRILLDFLHMFRIDLETGDQQPIAWIDEAGSCFFPEIFAEDCCHHQCGRDEDHMCRDLSGPRELKLQLEIDINGVGLRECSGESNSLEEHVQNDQKPSRDQLAAVAEDGYDRVPDRKRSGMVEVDQQVEASLAPVVKPVEEELDADFLRKMFLMNMTSFGTVDIVDLQRCSSTLARARFQLFQKQAEITKQHRGDANIRYAWLAAPCGMVSSIITHGIGACGALTNKFKFGTGVHLTSANCPNISANCCDVDENGVRHMVFCRVIMGNMEHVHPGSRQSLPSGPEYDTGVDDLHNPAHYIVWTMNVNTHIHPEFIISFKRPLSAEGNLSGSGSKESGLTTSLKGTTQQYKVVDPIAINPGNDSGPDSDNGGSQGKAPTMGSSAPRVPRSPWMPFPMLFDAISEKVSPEVMDMIKSSYNSFKLKKLTREELIKKLRVIVGDDLLRSTITGLQCKIPTKHDVETMKNMNAST